VLLGFKISKHSTFNKSELKERAIHYLEKVKLEDSIHKYPHELSGGMQQRVAVVQTLFVNPALVLMDEPFGALDPGTREDLQLFLLELWEEHNMTVFFVTHDLEEALFLGTRLIVLSQYYTDDHHKSGIKKGSQVVMDLEVKPKFQALSTSSKNSEEFKKLLSDIRLKGFSPDHLQHAKDFDLHHPHSFETP
jgi:NitT/TauT family transport system ATP-binding protein